MGRAILASIVTFSTLAATIAAQRPEDIGCQADIVSSTVVGSFCGHRQGDRQVLDLLILWRGRPGWFHQKGPGYGGYSGSSSFGGGMKSVISESISYGDVRIEFDVNFNTGVLTIKQSTIMLDRINTVIVDNVDAAWNITNTRR